MTKRSETLKLDNSDVLIETGNFFINRDHIVSVSIFERKIIVTTTAGTRIIMPASGATAAKFADDLANAAQSNFVSITAPTEQLAPT
jgi:hypothetical protein